ncbi:hypothetical protein COO60DRAFT_1644819 [Scenedesmus sp. NREL 46B-D3]|nr:hypothetical protein COO60DRAFT_1644819 [Scenedesmus sp. NREL 46B-D3]
MSSTASTMTSRDSSPDSSRSSSCDSERERPFCPCMDEPERLRRAATMTAMLAPDPPIEVYFAALDAMQKEYHAMDCDVQSYFEYFTSMIYFEGPHLTYDYRAVRTAMDAYAERLSRTDAYHTCSAAGRRGRYMCMPALGHVQRPAAMDAFLRPGADDAAYHAAQMAWEEGRRAWKDGGCHQDALWTRLCRVQQALRLYEHERGMPMPRAA